MVFDAAMVVEMTLRRVLSERATPTKVLHPQGAMDEIEEEENTCLGTIVAHVDGRVTLSANRTGRAAGSSREGRSRKSEAKNGFLGKTRQ
jgi:hypothetical protein